MRNITIPLLGVLFVGLKLAHVLFWSWWWVTLPFWITPAAVLLVVLSAFLAAAVAGGTVRTRIRRFR